MDLAPPQQPKPAPEATPRLTLSLTGWKKLSARIANWPTNALAFTIKYEDDGLNKPCLFKWSPSDLILRLCPANDGKMKEAPVAEPQGSAPRHEPDSPGPFSPAAETTLYGTPPERYGPLLDVGRQYEVLWAGGEIAQWAWGTKREHQSQGQFMPPGPKITLPAGSRFRFTAHTPHWRPQNQTLNQNRPRPPLVEPSGAPVLTVTLEVDDGKITGREWDIELRLQTKVTYHGILGGATSGPIMLYVSAVIQYESYVQLDRRRNGTTWEPVTPAFLCNIGAYLTGLPRGFARGQHGLFVCLQPGESWIDTLDAYDGESWEFPPNLAHGDVFRLQHRGCVIDWWSCGGPRDLATTLASFPSYDKDTVVYPTDLDGGAKLVVPASDPIELVYEEQD
ncbi:hypothetical protein BDW72DRAFT_210224 [Aspergillus terricola var. indicus]